MAATDLLLVKSPPKTGFMILLSSFLQHPPFYSLTVWSDVLNLAKVETVIVLSSPEDNPMILANADINPPSTIVVVRTTIKVTDTICYLCGIESLISKVKAKAIAPIISNKPYPYLPLIRPANQITDMSLNDIPALHLLIAAYNPIGINTAPALAIDPAKIIRRLKSTEKSCSLIENRANPR